MAAQFDDALRTCCRCGSQCAVGEVDWLLLASDIWECYCSFRDLEVESDLLLADISWTWKMSNLFPVLDSSHDPSDGSKDIAVWANFKGWRWFRLRYSLLSWSALDCFQWDENVISITGTPGDWMGPVPLLTLPEVEDKLYCKSCWKDYGWYVKRGPPYTLSLNLDRLARKHGVRIVEVHIGKGKAKGKGFLPQTLGRLMGRVRS